MTAFVLDTDTFTLHAKGHPTVVANVGRQLSSAVGLSIITVDEVLSGWFTYIRRAKSPQDTARGYRRLASAVSHLASYPMAGFELPAISRYDSLLKLRLNVRANDLRISAIALEVGATVVSRNLRDFRRVPGLSVVDWSA